LGNLDSVVPATIPLKFQSVSFRINPKAAFFLDQNQPKTPKISKSSQPCSCHLAGVHHRQTDHTETKKLG